MARLNLDLFKNESHEKYYLLGFVAADGCIYGKSLIITLHKQDLSLLHVFCDWLHLPHTTVKSRNVDYVEFRKYNQELVDCFAYYGILPRKTKTLEISPNIPSQYLKSFILGYFDGDGSCYTNKDGSKLYFQIVGTKSVNQKIRETFCDDLCYNFGSIQSSGEITRLIINGCKSSLDFGAWLYQDDLFCLNRKKSVYQKYLSLNLDKYQSGLNMIKAREIREKYSTGMFTQAQLAEEYHVCRQSISDVLRGRNYKDSSKQNSSGVCLHGKLRSFCK